MIGFHEILPAFLVVAYITTILKLLWDFLIRSHELLAVFQVGLCMAPLSKILPVLFNSIQYFISDMRGPYT